VVTSLDTSLPDPNSESGNVNWRILLGQTLPYVDIFVPSIEEALFMLRRADYDRWGDDWINEVDRAYLDSLANELLGMGAKIVGFKLSDRGLYLCVAKNLNESALRWLSIDLDLWEGAQVWHPAFRVSVIGTTGAGDSAYAGFLSALIKGLNPQNSVQMACAVGAFNVEASDALGGIRHWDEIAARIQHGWQTLDFKLAGF
jgi:sugar/nucleoside kinase (ribokinase family)